jgi:lambda family phage tail tape measure protein
MIAGTLEVQMLANLARLAEDMHKAKGIVGDAVGAIEKTLGALGLGFSASVLIDKIDSVTESMAKLKLASDKTGNSVEDMSKLGFLAGVSGSSVEGVTTALSLLSKGMSSTGNESAKFSQAMKALDLSVLDDQGNMKKSSVLYEEIAQKLYQYDDGAGKTAIAMALMGRVGAEQLPIMKKLVEEGGAVATVTTEQAEAAERYRITVGRLDQQKQILWNTIVSALLPSMDSFYRALISAAKETDSLGSKAKTLAGDGSIQSWADASAMGIARFVDVVKVGVQATGALIASMKVVADDIEKPAKHAALIAAWMTPGSGVTKQMGDEMWKEQLDEYAKDLADANQKYAALYNDDKTAFSRSVADKIELAKNARKFMEDEGGAAPPKKQLDFRPVSERAADAERKLFTSSLQSLEKAYFGLTHEGQRATVMWETEHGSLAKLLPEHKAELLLMADKIDAYHALLINQAQAVQLVISLTEAREKALVIEDDYVAAMRRESDDLRFSLDTVGKTRNEMERLSAARKIDLDLREKINSLPKDDEGNVAAGALPAMERMQRAADAAKASQLGLIAARQQAERDWTVGAKTAFDEYIDMATNTAVRLKDVIGRAFKGMEDALVQFTMTGKLDFRSLANSIIADMIRMQIQASITKPLAALGASFIGSLTGATQAPAPVTDAVIVPNALGAVHNSVSLSALSGGIYNRPTFFRLASGGVLGEAGYEAVMPLTRGPNGKLGVQASGGGGVMINVTVNAETGSSHVSSSEPSLRQLGSILGAKMREEIIKQQRPGGLLDRTAA